MKKNINNMVLLLTLAVIHANYAGAFQVSLDVDINTSTEYHDCQGYAQSIVELVKLFINATNDDTRAKLDANISFMKTELKKCEKRNKKGKNNYAVNVGVKHDFSK